MAEKKKKILSVKEAFAAQCVNAEVIEAFGNFEKGDTINRHKSTIAALKAKKLVK